MNIYHPTVQKILDLLKQTNFWFETFEHEPVKTSEQAALTRPGYTLHQGAKAMIVKVYPNTKKIILTSPLTNSIKSSNNNKSTIQDFGVGASKTKSYGKFVMLVFPADQKFDSDKVRKSLNVKSLRFATEAEVGELTVGVQIGGVPPFGNLFNLDVYADPSLFLNEKIVFNAGDRGFSVAMKSADYRTIINPQITALI
jgi:prolyl-tRNA editing enzyme YbaK/EbsC (Cys-tRNA(Pro) deacylase)